MADLDQNPNLDKYKNTFLNLAQGIYFAKYYGGGGGITMAAGEKNEN